MKYKNYHSLVFLTLLFSVSVFSQTTLNYTIGKWFDNKKAASSFTFDDALSGQFTDAMPILEANNIKGTFFIITNNVPTQLGGWKLVQQAITNGHEIGNHTVSHPTLGDLTEDEIDGQLKNANDLIMTNTQSKPVTMAYPNGSGGGDTPADQKVRSVVKQYFIGARAVGGLFNEYNFADNEENYFKVKSPMIFEATTADEVGKSLESTIAGGGWYCPTYHGVVNGWIIVPKQLFEAHVKEYAKRSKDLWMTTFSKIVKYHRERKTARLIQISEDSKSWVLSLTDTLSNNSLWNQELTLNLERPSWTIFSISQNGKVIPYIIVGNQVIFSAIPDGGNIVFGKVNTAANNIIEQDKSWKISQNPVGNTINILNLKEGKDYHINITTISGSVYKTLNLTAKNNQILMPCNDFMKGLYLVNIDGLSQKLILN